MSSSSSRLGIVRDEIFGLRGLELETSAHGAGAAAQIEQIELGVVVENDPVFERGFDFGAGLQVDAVELGVGRRAALSPAP